MVYCGHVSRYEHGDRTHEFSLLIESVLSASGILYGRVIKLGYMDVCYWSEGLCVRVGRRDFAIKVSRVHEFSLLIGRVSFRNKLV